MYYVIAGLKESYSSSLTPRRHGGGDNELKLLSFLQLQHHDEVSEAHHAQRNDEPAPELEYWTSSWLCNNSSMRSRNPTNRMLCDTLKGRNGAIEGWL
jgi:hypothetical protein